MVNVVKGFKVFNPDWTCRDYDFKNGQESAVGTIHDTGVDPVLCESGFHFCTNVVDCFKYYSFDPANKVARVVGRNVTNSENGCSKVASQILEVECEVSWEELLKIANTGYGNTGYGNTGDWNTGNQNTGYRNTGYRNTGYQNTGYQNTGNQNTGYRNTGDWNTGDWNTGNWNTGNWNICDRESGFFNSEESDTIRVFNRPCPRSEWEKAKLPDFLFFEVTYWDEKEDEQKSRDFKEAFKDSWKNASKAEREMLLNLPNFDKGVFFEISGIDIDKD